MTSEGGTAQVSRSLSTLRAFTYRLSSTPAQQLPYTANHIARSLWSCRDVLSSISEQPKARNEVALAVHRFKTLLSSLLQDRNVDSRFAAILLIKSTIEAGGVQVLSNSFGWIKSLIGILKKPDPPAIKSLAIVTLSRIFMLTWSHSHLVRELTTQNLPAFVSNCINILSKATCSETELEAVLTAFGLLIARHPTIFRAQETLLRPLLEKIVSSSAAQAPSSKTYYTSSHQALARRLLVAFHSCAPKQAEARQWSQTLEAAVNSAHETCDGIFRSVHEHWKPSTAPKQNGKISANIDSLESTGKDASGFGPWQGILEGSDRLISLLRLIQSHIGQKSAGTVSVRVGMIVELLARLFSVTSPSYHADGSVAANSNFTNDERTLMLSVLPNVLEAALNIQKTLALGFGRALTSFIPQSMEMAAAVFENQGSHVQVKATVYSVIESIVLHHGIALSEEDVKEIGPMIHSCCRDLLATANELNTAVDATTSEGTKVSSISNLTSSQNSLSLSTSVWFLGESSSRLIAVGIGSIRPDFLSSKLRTMMERTAILTQHKAALIACVSNPQARRRNAQLSLLPHLAQLYPEIPELEMLLRPRLPLIEASRIDGRIADAPEYDEDPHQAMNGDGAADSLDFVAINHAPDTAQTIEGNGRASDQIMPLPNIQDLGSAGLSEAFQRESAAVEYPQPDNKRKITDTDVDETLIKRKRHVFRSDPPDADISIEPAGPVQERAMSELYAEENLPQASRSSEQPGTINDPADVTIVADNQKQDPSVEIGDDGSDFEMPPLTMESDTDPEDDDGR